MVLEHLDSSIRPTYGKNKCVEKYCTSVRSYLSIKLCDWEHFSFFRCFLLRQSVPVKSLQISSVKQLQSLALLISLQINPSIKCPTVQNSPSTKGIKLRKAANAHITEAGTNDSPAVVLYKLLNLLSKLLAINCLLMD